MEEQLTTQTQPAAEATLSPDAIGALRLAAKLWLFATALYLTVRLADILVFPLRERPQHYRYFMMFDLDQPRIISGTSFLPVFVGAVLPFQLFIAGMAISSLTWTGSCWLLADAALPSQRASAPWLRIVSTAALLLGIAGSFVPDSIVPIGHLDIWFRVSESVDPIVALVVAIFLRKISFLIDDAVLRWIANLLPWTVGGALLLRLLDMLAEHPMDAVYYCQRGLTYLYSFALVVAMMRLWMATRVKVNREPAGSPPA